MHIQLTGNCRICTSEYGQAITQKLIDGATPKEIIAQYPSLKLSRYTVYRHRRHFVSSETVEAIKFIDELRRLAVAYIDQSRRGVELSSTQARIIQTALSGILKRRQLEDSHEVMQALAEMLERASQAAERHDGSAGNRE